MLRPAFVLLVSLLLAGPQACAQDWAIKMFDSTSHDFGVVARGTKAEYRFQLKNLYEEDVHILGVRSSCGCTTPHITRSDLKTFETGEIVAEFNTKDFQGTKQATIDVTLDKPFHAVVQLRVAGFIRTDVVMQPGAIDMGSVDLGSAAEKRMQVTYTGRDDWKILDVKTTDPHFEVELTEVARGGGKIVYQLLVRLKKDAPVGYIKDQLLLVTSDPRARELPVNLEGRVVPGITISPAKWFIGVVHPGDRVTKNLVVTGKKPFRILDVKCPDKSFSVEPSKDSKSVHLLKVVFTAGEDPGRVAQKISIRTDQGENVVQASAFAEVVKSDAVEKPVEEEATAPAADEPQESTSGKAKIGSERSVTRLRLKAS